MKLNEITVVMYIGTMILVALLSVSAFWKIT